MPRVTPRRHVWDYGSLEVRERGCRAELRLNRRLAPSVYLDVVPLTCNLDGELRLGPGGRVVDWLIKMRRLSADHALDTSFRSTGGVSVREQSGVIALLARFYRAADRRPLSADSYLRSLRIRSAQDAVPRGVRAIGDRERSPT